MFSKKRFFFVFFVRTLYSHSSHILHALTVSLFNNNVRFYEIKTFENKFPRIHRVRTVINQHQ